METPYLRIAAYRVGLLATAGLGMCIVTQKTREQACVRIITSGRNSTSILQQCRSSPGILARSSVWSHRFQSCPVAKIFSPNADPNHSRSALGQWSAERNIVPAAEKKRAHTVLRIRSYSCTRSPAKSGPGRPVYADAASGAYSCCYSRFTLCKRHIHTEIWARR